MQFIQHSSEKWMKEAETMELSAFVFPPFRLCIGLLVLGDAGSQLSPISNILPRIQNVNGPDCP